MPDNGNSHHVVIVGGGFAGLGCAQRLAERDDVRVTLIDRNNYHQFQPLLYQVATSLLAPSDIAHSLRSVFADQDNVDVQLAEVTAVDTTSRTVTAADGGSWHADALVLAAGSQPNFFHTPGAAEHTFPLYSLDDATRLRSRILGLFEHVDRDPSLIDRGALNFVIVGGGPTGVEVAGALADMVGGTVPAEYRNFDASAARIHLLDYGDTLLRAFSDDAHGYVARVLQERNVVLNLGTGVKEVGPGHALLSDGTVVATRCVIWGGGITGAPIAAGAGVTVARGGRIDVQRDLTLAGTSGVYVVGDIANIPGPGDQALPQLGSVALQSGKLAADNILADFDGKERQDFVYKDKGIMAMIGRGAAIAEVGKRHHEVHGQLAHVAWLGVHASLMTGTKDKIEAIIDWSWDRFSKTSGPHVLDRGDEADIDWNDDPAVTAMGTPGFRELSPMANDLARWQFAITIIYHFFFVPVTIGLAFLVAILQTIWYRTDNPDYKRLTRFFGTLLLINAAIGVVTGLVQEFQFGMNWSTYSRYVGGVFGAPLAMEGILAFFLESTFLGLWVFGWDRLPKRVHLACIWAVSAGSMLSAMFILIANSWMQHPVGYRIDKQGQAVLTNVWALFVNPTFVWGYAHVLLASLVTGCLVMLAVSAWYLRKGDHVELFHRPAKLALIVLIPAIVIQLSVGNQLGVIEARYQPMKIAAAEAQWNTCKPCSFSLFQIGGGANDQTPSQILEIPHLLSVLATNMWNGEVIGLHQLQAQYQAKYGPGNYVPDVFIQYWSIRIMAGLGTLVLLLSLWGAWLLHKNRLHMSRLFLTLSVWAVFTPFLMNTTGWLLTESGRQPWIVQGLQKTVNANSPSVSSTEIWISLIAFVLSYIGLGVADLVLMLRYSRKGLAHADAEAALPSGPAGAGAAAPALTY